MWPGLLEPFLSVLDGYTTQLPSDTARVIIDESDHNVLLHVWMKHHFFMEELTSFPGAVDQDLPLLCGRRSYTFFQQERIEESKAETRSHQGKKEQCPKNDVYAAGVAGVEVGHERHNYQAQRGTAQHASRVARQVRDGDEPPLATIGSGQEVGQQATRHDQRQSMHHGLHGGVR